MKLTFYDLFDYDNRNSELKSKQQKTENSEEQVIEERLLILRASRGDEKAKNNLLESHRLLIKDIVSQFYVFGNEEDLLQQGLLSFSEALASWDISNLYNFGDYCYWAVKYDAIQTSIRNWILSLDGFYDDVDIISYDQIISKLDISDDLTLKFLQLKSNTPEIDRLNDSIIDFMTHKEGIAKEIILHLLKNLLDSRMSILNGLERKIIIFKYGLLDKQFHSSQTLSYLLDIGEGHILEIEKNAIQKIKALGN